MNATVVSHATFTGRAEQIDFVQRAKDLIPVLRERSDGVIAARSVATETIDDYRSAGFMKFFVPKRFGGLEIDFSVFSEVLETLAQGCGSSAWVACTLIEHSWFLSCLTEQAQIDIWGGNPDACASASFSPKPVKQVEGGYLVSATWSFSSGCDFAQWAFLGAMTPEGMIFMAVPMTDLEIVDDWHALGLRGTGSKSLKLTDVFVPAYRTVSVLDLMRCTQPGRAVHPDYYILRAPQQLLAPYSLPSVVLGMAQRGLDIFIASIDGKRLPGPGGALVADQQMVQFAVAEAQAEIEIARTRIRSQIAIIVALAKAGPIEAERMFDARRDFSVITQRLVRVVLDLCAQSGSRWVYEDDPMQLVLRDMITASAHNGALPASVVSSGRETLGLSGASYA